MNEVWRGVAWVLPAVFLIESRVFTVVSVRMFAAVDLILVTPSGTVGELITGPFYI